MKDQDDHGTSPPGGWGGEVPGSTNAGLRLRPFLLTAGRARSAGEQIALETQVVSTHFGYVNWKSLDFERRDLVAVCGVPLSVAEICAQLSLHLGVVRVLIGDLAAEGYLTVHVPDEQSTHSVHTIMRVLNGLRAIT
ncbi:DUF742 domain-containing protein [Streptomyces mirabilis]